MSYTVKIFNKETDEKYIPEIKALADFGLSSGFLTDEDIKGFGTKEYFCSFVVNENDTVCCISYGKFIDIEAAAHELRSTVEEVKAKFPGVTSFATHLGMARRPEDDGHGLGDMMMKLHTDIVFPYADVILNIVWNRNGGEHPIVHLLKKHGTEFYKSVPLYWYDYPDLYCTVCNGRCKCGCDLYYYTKEGFIK